MMRIALCGDIDCSDKGIEELVLACAHEESVDSPALDVFATPVDLVDACANTLLEEPYDLVIAAMELPGISGIQMVRELRELGLMRDGLRVVLADARSAQAYGAYASGVTGYLVEPVDQEQATRVMRSELAALVRLHEASHVFHCRDRARRVSFSNLAYVETNGHDQVLHLVGDERELSVRCSSKALFAPLEGDGRFFKLGSSYIINLARVTELSTRGGTVTLDGAMQLPVPVRLRKPLVEALCAHCAVCV